MFSLPRYVERLRIGGGFGESKDGGTDIDADGTIRTDGDVIVRGTFSAGTPPQQLTNPSGEIDGRKIQAQSVGGSQIDPNGTYTVRSLYVQDTLVAENGLQGYNRREGLSAEDMIFACHFDSARSIGASVVGDTFLDWSGNENHVKVVNQGIAVLGKIGKGLQLSGVNGFARTSDTTLANTYGGGPLTFAVWIKTTDAATDPRVVMGFVGGAPNYPYVRLVLVAGKAQVRVRGDNAIPAQVLEGHTPVNDGIWHHLVAVIPAWGTSGKIQLYVDGVLDVEGTDTRTATSTCASYFYVGSANGAAQFFAGTLDEALVWKRALSAGEICALYMMKSEFPLALYHALVAGTLRVRGGNVECGTPATERGVVSILHGGTGSAPGCLKLHAADGSAWYFFVDTNGVLRVYNSLPMSGGEGTIVGSQG